MKTKILLLSALIFGAVLTPAIAQTNPAPAVSKVVTIGSAVDIALVSVEGTLPYSFQWAKDGQDIRGATSATLKFAAVAVSDVGTYTLKVTNAEGSAVSNSAALTVKLIAPGKVIISFAPAD